LSPGIYVPRSSRVGSPRSFNYRQESDGIGIPSYPHPWLMPDLAVPTVSMGLGR
jgi:pyruvate dehydrogenase E1 component